ncbi:hypothetical protein LSTR_LSTR004606 [Laodelphax striatellus]|uniref:E3 SUMO-protein ligase NSE2 n=1 Tax=Laodelphax striatellus TaxID=195883 RepID=A0A482WTW6_LAOST|nr:hypothetical protein LSTR_LSTR004606 [Laodelphax striatellus]
MNQLRRERDSLYKDIHSMVLSTAQLMCKNLKDEDVEDFIEKLEKDEILVKYCKQEESWKSAFQYIDSQNVPVEDECMVYEAIQKQPKNPPEHCHFYTQFREKMDGILHPEDTDLLETQCTINLIDPISKSRMKDPVKNVICNHTYDRYSIAEIMKRKSATGIRCPYQGCNNRELFKLQDLVPDEITKQALLSAEADSD